MRKLKLVPINEAISDNDVEAFNSLLSECTNLEETDYAGRTPLYCAVQFNRVEMASLLLKKGANVHIRDEYGNTLLIMACLRYGNEEMIKLLISYGVDINATNNYGNSAVSLAHKIANFPFIPELNK